MEKILRVGILGCANIAAKYAIAAFKSLPNVELVAIASRDQDKAKAWGEKYALQPESYKSLIAHNDIDIIYSPLPVGEQEEWVIKAMEAGKHVICEKSITYSFASVQKMVAASEKNGVALYENFVPDFHPQHKQILALIKEGKIGTPHVFRGAYGFPSFPDGDIRLQKELKGGALNDAGCYTVFMARKILGAEPVAVTCVLSSEGQEVDMEGSALLEFPKATAEVAFGFNHLYQNNYSVWGSKGVVRTDRAYAIPPDLPPPVELITNDGAKETKAQLNIPAANQFQLSFEYFCNAVQQGDTKEIASMRTHILAQAKVLEAMRISAREHRRVEISQRSTIRTQGR